MQAVLILLGVTLVTFVLLYLLPADPARQIAGRSATPADGREHPPPARPRPAASRAVSGAIWPASLHGDLGRSYVQKTEVADADRRRGCRRRCC